MPDFVGQILCSAAERIPWYGLICDGTAVSRTTYAELYAEIGDRWGAGDGSTTFNLPEMRNQIPVGQSPGNANFDRLADSFQLAAGTGGVFARVYTFFVVWTLGHEQMAERVRRGEV